MADPKKIDPDSAVQNTTPEKTNSDGTPPGNADGTVGNENSPDKNKYVVKAASLDNGDGVHLKNQIIQRGKLSDGVMATYLQEGWLQPLDEVTRSTDQAAKLGFADRSKAADFTADGKLKAMKDKAVAEGDRAKAIIETPVEVRKLDGEGTLAAPPKGDSPNFPQDL